MLENLTLYIVGVGLMGSMFMFVLSVFTNMVCSSGGVCRFFGRCWWLCMQIIDVSDGFRYW